MLVDISKKYLDICRKRFTSCSNIEFYLIRDISLTSIDKGCIDDAIWPYDVFVHINPTNTKKYLVEYKGILQPGGYTIIHHSEQYPNQEHVNKNFRSYPDGEFFAHRVTKHDVEMVEQNDTLAHNLGDLISMFKKKDPSPSEA